MDRRIILLNSPVVTGSEEFAAAGKEGGADRNPAFGQTLVRFLYSHF
jgi:hypothetical protein